MPLLNTRQKPKIEEKSNQRRILNPSNHKSTFSEDNNFGPNLTELCPLMAGAPDLNMKEGLETPSDDCEIATEADSIDQQRKIRTPPTKKNLDQITLTTRATYGEILRSGEIERRV